MNISWLYPTRRYGDYSSLDNIPSKELFIMFPMKVNDKLPYLKI